MTATLKIGADPELFVKLADGQFISGHVFECGTKANPMLTKHGAVQVDGMALEFNVTPAENKVEFVNNTISVLKDLNQLVGARYAGAKLVAIPVCDFGKEYIQSVPEIASALGCNPDFDGYTKEPNPVPNAELPFRTGSGHIHIGWTDGADSREHFELCCDVAKELDYYIGLPSLLWDKDNRRRELYGRPGAFRPKPYGMEYRVPSNAWLKSRQTIEFVYDRASKGAMAVLKRKRKPLFEKFGDVAKELINNPHEAVRLAWPKNHQAIAAQVLRDAAF